MDRRDVRGAFKLPKQPEFLFSEEAMVHRRSWSENLTYYTGVGYLSGEPGGRSAALRPRVGTGRPSCGTLPGGLEVAAAGD